MNPAIGQSPGGQLDFRRRYRPYRPPHRLADDEDVPDTDRAILTESAAAPARSRWVYAGLACGAILSGLASRRFAAALPVCLRKSPGDALWALMVFLLVGLLCPRRPTLWNATIAFLFSVGIEFSQLYHAPWINRLRGHTLGHLVLGSGFAWEDMPAYAIGVLIGLAGEWIVSGLRTRFLTSK